jgi:hypothetical protein
MARIFEIHDTVEGVLMEAPIKIKQSSSSMNVKSIRINLTIK